MVYISGASKNRLGTLRFGSLFDIPPSGQNAAISGRAKHNRTVAKRGPRIWRKKAHADAAFRLGFKLPTHPSTDHPYQR
jgi:hypothetical protein